MKKMFLKLVLFCLCLCCQIGRGGTLTPEDQQAKSQGRKLWGRLTKGIIAFGGIKMQSVKEGDSFTLGSLLPKMKNYDVIQWRYYNTSIAKIDKQTWRSTVYDVPDGRFRDRLKLDSQTGSLTITDIRPEHAGIYYLHLNGTIRETFYLSVHAKPLSVMKRDSVTLNSGLTEIMDDDLIEWRFLLIKLAEFNKRANRITVYDDVLDGIFRDRLELDNQTGSLTITDIRLEHEGVYRLRRTGRTFSSKMIRVSVYATLPFPDINANFSQCSTTQQYCSLVCSVRNVTDVSHVTLSWYKGNSLLSSISASDLSISLSLPLEIDYFDKNTYSCVLSNPISNKTSDMDVEDISIYCNICSAFGGTVITTAKMGDSVTLNSGFENRNIDLIKWSFRSERNVIAEMNNLTGNVTVYNGDDGRFRNRLNVDLQTGSLTIRNITSQHCGSYTVHYYGVEKYRVLLTQNEISVKEGDSVTLNYGFTHKDFWDFIQWYFILDKEFEIVANLDDEYPDAANGRFRDRLTFDKNVGSLTIRNITTEHAGVYVLYTSDLCSAYNITVDDSVKL